MTGPISLPFDIATAPESETVKMALRLLEAHVRALPVDSFLQAQKIQDYAHSLQSLASVEIIEYADFLRYQINSGRKITYISPLNYAEITHLLKTTKAVTDIPDGNLYGSLSIMVMPGHTLRRENPKDHTKIYDWSGNNHKIDLTLPRDVASIMLARLWKPHPDHFGENCRLDEIDKLLKRGRKSPKVYAGLNYAIQSPQ